MANLPIAKKFHGYLDAARVQRPDLVIETEVGQHFTRQAGEISYRFYPHFHPYVKQLTQRLLRQGISGLQAADTEYTRDGASIHGSIVVAIGSNQFISLDNNLTFTLLTDTHGTDVSTGERVPLVATNKYRTVQGREWRLRPTNRFTATLLSGNMATPSPGTDFILPLGMEANLLSSAKADLVSASISVGLREVQIHGAEVLLDADTFLPLTGGTQVKLLKRKRLPVPEFYADDFGSRYNPTSLVQPPYPVNDLDFTPRGAYSVYNWELFFHVPLTIGIHLSKNQRFAEAQRWFHYLFDPTDDSDGPTPERFWKVRPFQYTDVKKVEEILVNLVTGTDEDLRNETIDSIEAWKDAPFRPHVIARYRQQAYMYKTVMAYLDNLIAWGDSLFRQDTGEAIDEALMLYVLAANILGPRAQPVPKKGSVRLQTYDNLRKDLKQFGTVLRDVEADLPFDLMPFPASDSGGNDRLVTVRSLGKALYFGVPRNDKLLSYWDTVADRLFKIRNSLNILGIFRQVPLFEPPIDPALLAKAAAAGVDVAAIVNGLNQPLPLVRFQLLVQNAAEIVQEVKSLGNNLLAAMEKEDGEAMAILRAKHERLVMEMVEHVKYGQHQEAIKSTEALYNGLKLALQRHRFYEQQLGATAEGNLFSIMSDLKKGDLYEMKLDVKEPEWELRPIEVDIAQDLEESRGRIISSHEQLELEELGNASRARTRAADLDMSAKLVALIPEFGANVQPIGVGMTVAAGGRLLSAILSFAADYQRIRAEEYTYSGGVSEKIGRYARREQDWAFQSNLAVGEINQIFKQLRAAQIREAVAELELKNHQKQMKHAEEIERFLNEEGTEKTGKKTNKALYAWMKREVKGLYGQCFQFAFDIAKKAERALQHELGNPELSYLKFGYLAGKDGLLAGEKLYLDIKRMEMAYHDLNQREYELTKHVSLLQVDPLALIQLRATGACTVRLDENLFDMDGPGHYFRRIKTVAVSIPCVIGPYASVNCTLTLLKSSIRKTQILRDGVYAREDAEDDRFNDYFGSLQSIVTSSGQNDSGLFETNLRDERYLPFENSGVISEWQLQLPASPSKREPCQFDYDTISNVILHIRYTAREGGGLLRSGALADLQRSIDEAQAAGSVRLFSVRHEFSTEWAKFHGRTPAVNQRLELTLKFREEHYPFWSKGRLNKVKRVDILARSSANPVPGSIDIFQSADPNDNNKKGTLSGEPTQGNLLIGPLIDVRFTQPDGESAEKPTGELELFFFNNSLSDLWIAVTWSGT